MKNIIIAILAIALGISGYFNYQFKQEDSKTFKIRKGTDALEIIFYGNRIDTQPGGKPLPQGPGLRNFIRVASIQVVPSETSCNPDAHILCFNESLPGGHGVTPADSLRNITNLTVKSFRIFEFHSELKPDTK